MGWENFLLTNVQLKHSLSCGIVVFVFPARHLFPAVFQQEPCFVLVWSIFLTGCFLTRFPYLTTFPASLALFSHLPYNNLLIFPLPTFSIVPFFSPPCFVASPWAVLYSPVAPCVSDGLPRAGHPVGLASTCFCSWCLNPEGTSGV